MARTLILGSNDSSTTSKFPEYLEPLASTPRHIPSIENSSDLFESSHYNADIMPLSEHKLINQVTITPIQESFPESADDEPLSGKGKRILRSQTVGYVAPVFMGKRVQKDDGQLEI